MYILYIFIYLMGVGLVPMQQPVPFNTEAGCDKAAEMYLEMAPPIINGVPQQFLLVCNYEPVVREPGVAA